MTGMPEKHRNLLTVREASSRLRISPTTLYDWLGRSKHGLLIIRGSVVTIDYFQGGPQGQGRIAIESSEVERILELMRVRPVVLHKRRAPTMQQYPGINVPLGLPDDL
jgi:predicted site-specific integrase-resolvase